jgi:hypothetical protein
VDRHPDDTPKRVVRTVLALAMLSAQAASFACGGDGPTGPSRSSSGGVCSEVSLAGAANLNIGINGCSSTSASIGPIRYVGATSIVQSYDFTIACTVTGRRYTGTVTVATRTAVVNGATCRF